MRVSTASRFFGFAAVFGVLSCQPRDYNRGTNTESAAVPGANECKSSDPFAITGKNTKTGACVPLDQFRVLNFLEGKPAPYGYVNSAESYGAFAARYGFRTKVTNFQNNPIIANLKHDGKFWVAQLDLTQVSNIYFQVEEFKLPVKKEDVAKNRAAIDKALLALRKLQAELNNPALSQEIDSNVDKLLNGGEYYAAHGQVRMDFKAPVLLAAHSDPKVRTSVKSLVFSVHAVAEKYDPIEGVSGVYPLALGVYSAAEKFNSSVVVQKNPIREYKLNMKPDEFVQYATLYFKRAMDDYRKTDYNTLFANCGNIPFETIEKSYFTAKYGAIFNAAQASKAVQLGRSYPKYAQYALQAYKLLADPNNMKGTPWTSLSLDE